MDNLIKRCCKNKWQWIYYMTGGLQSTRRQAGRTTPMLCAQTQPKLTVLHLLPFVIRQVHVLLWQRFAEQRGLRQEVVAYAAWREKEVTWHTLVHSSLWQHFGQHLWQVLVFCFTMPEKKSKTESLDYHYCKGKKDYYQILTGSKTLTLKYWHLFQFFSKELFQKYLYNFNFDLLADTKCFHALCSLLRHDAHFVSQF